MEEKSQKKPSFQFYPGDWRRDPNLQQNSLAARGLWQEILCIMHDQPERGILSLETEKNLWRLVGDKDSNVRRLLKELENSGVFSRDEKGRMFNRRMVRDTKLSLTRSACGSLGGNPNLVNQNSSNGLSKFEAKPKQTVEQNPTPSSSSSSSKINTPPSPPGGSGRRKNGGGAETPKRFRVFPGVRDLLGGLSPERSQGIGFQGMAEAEASPLRVPFRSSMAEEVRSVDKRRRILHPAPGFMDQRPTVGR